MTLLGAAIVWLFLVFVIVGSVWAVRAAKRGGKTIKVVGAGMTLMTLGNVQDPSNEAVLAAQQPRKKESGESGDPPDSED